MKLRTRILVFSLIIIIPAVFIFTPLVIAMTTGNAILADVLVALDDTTDDILQLMDEEDSEQNYTEYIIGENCFDELHRKILMLGDLSDKRLYRILHSNYIDGKKVTPLKTGSGKDFSTLAYIYLYKLAAEICLRKEINPPSSNVRITPLDLIGESFCESGLMNYEEPMSTNRACIWMSKDTITNQHIEVAALDLQRGEDWGSPWDSTSSRAKEYNLGNCPSFFGQAMFYNYVWGSTYGDTAQAFIYISSEENPDLADDKRAVYGNRKDLYDGLGKYVTDTFWNTNWESSAQLASYDELEHNIKQGIFTKGQEFGYQTRPATYYLPDSMYTHAIHIRSFLNNRSQGTPYLHSTAQPGGWDITKLETIIKDKQYGASLSSTQAEYLAIVMKMYVLTRFIGDSPAASTQFATYTTGAIGSCGALPETYCNLVVKKVNPLVAMNEDDMALRSSLLGQPNSFCGVYILGDSNLGSKKIDGIHVTDLALDFSGNHSLYGFDCLNAGALATPAFKAVIDGVYNACEHEDLLNKSSPAKAIIKQESTVLCWPLPATNTTILPNGYYGTRNANFHPGVDIQCEAGSSVYAVAAGKVLAVGDDWIVLEHSANKSTSAMYSIYAHLSTSTGVNLKPGDKVSQRQQIGVAASYSAETTSLTSGAEYPTNPENGRGYLHFGICLFEPSRLTEYTYLDYEHNSSWNLVPDNAALFRTCLNPVALTWYSTASKDSETITIQSHQGDNLQALYGKLGPFGYNSADEEAIAKWQFSWNYSKNDGSTTLLKEIDVTSSELNVYGLDTTRVFNNFCGYSTTAADISDCLAGIQSELVSRSSISADITSVLGISCGPPITAKYFTEETLTQCYAHPWENDNVSPNGSHAGIDIGGEYEILAVTDGEITEVSHDANGAFGNYIVLKLDKTEDAYVKYCHLKTGSIKVKKGDMVKKGQVMGVTGTTGYSKGIHLHLELWLTRGNEASNLAKLFSLKYINGSMTVRYINDRHTYDPWLLYCLDPQYDWLRKGPDLGYGSPPYVIFTLRVPAILTRGQGTVKILMDPEGNPSFREEIKKWLPYFS